MVLHKKSLLLLLYVDKPYTSDFIIPQEGPWIIFFEKHVSNNDSIHIINLALEEINGGGPYGYFT